MKTGLGRSTSLIELDHPIHLLFWVDGTFLFVNSVIFDKEITRRLHIDTTEAEAFRAFSRIYPPIQKWVIKYEH
jgi:hypothetical protein